MHLTFLVAVFALETLLLRVLLVRIKNHTPIPRPMTFSLFGNAHQLGKRPQTQLKKWASDYGELFQIRIHSERWIFVNSIEAVKFIFDKKVTSTSSKKPMPVLFNLVSGCMRFFLMPKSHQWRTLRTIIQAQLKAYKSDTCQSGQETEATQLCYDILTDNKD